MFASVTSVVLVGVEPRPVRVEVHVGGSKEKFSIVGLPDTSVREARDRVKAALASCGYRLKSGTITVNLSPADLPKAGSAYDLPIALAVLAAMNVVPPGALGDVVALGELALDGRVRPVVGALAAAVVAERTDRRCLVPDGSAVAIGGGHVVPVADLAEAIAVAHGVDTGRRLPDSQPPPLSACELSDVRGQDPARRALEIAAAGGHHLLMTGAPGAGKTMLARCLPGILPPLHEAEALDVALAWGAAGLDRGPEPGPPFRSPHHSATMAALIGGGSGVPVPGEATLAHHGVLFLDELGEFPVQLLDALRQPLEEGHVVVARKGSSVRFPCRFQLVAATNPCPCGHEGDRLKECGCTRHATDRYRRRFSGPLLDRVDLRVRVARLDPWELSGPAAESSAAVRSRVQAARKRQGERGGLNRDLTRRELDGLPWGAGAETTLSAAVNDLELTARGWDRVRRVAVTIADLAESEVVTAGHVAEALAFRGSW